MSHGVPETEPSRSVSSDLAPAPLSCLAFANAEPPHYHHLIHLIPPPPPIALHHYLAPAPLLPRVCERRAPCYHHLIHLIPPPPLIALHRRFTQRARN
ncbi:hypothetical protein PILCRDRAFT_16120 [Piloderma croceum F 1598]|uniref:Uncharacterized protein n=1 Tax=Piloderma croceum (strain F 1598) TaxID=765440 RepID=A0A0C3EIH4_PILCF|nr:hypothetical protein PILCRDRAFT_16120 [Piloderma croceum F 1598]